MKLGAKSALLCVVLVFVLASAQVLPMAAQSGEDGGLFILVTNDDGYDAPGLKALAEALAPLGTVLVVAPQDNQSGKGHSTTGREFIRARSVEIAPGIKGYAVPATPATCARMGIEALSPRKPDLVVSGINRGRNLGVVVNYSGTVGAAREATIAGVAAIAVSNQGDDAKEHARTAEFVRELVGRLKAEGRIKPGLFLNVNAPAGEWKGVMVTRQSTTATPQTFDRITNPRGDLYYWSDYRNLTEDAEGTDVWAFVHGYISITPMQLDQSDSSGLGWLKELKLETGTPAPR